MRNILRNQIISFQFNFLLINTFLQIWFLCNTNQQLISAIHNVKCYTSLADGRSTYMYSVHDCLPCNVMCLMMTTLLSSHYMQCIMLLQCRWCFCPVGCPCHLSVTCTCMCMCKPYSKSLSLNITYMYTYTCD